MCALKLRFESESGWFCKQLPRNKVPNNYFLKLVQKHSSRLVFLKILQQKTPMLESPSNKIAGLKTGNFIKKKLHNKCFPVNIAKFLRAVFLQNTSCGYFGQFYEVTVQCWRSADLPFLIKNIILMLSTKKICRCGQSMFFTYYQQRPFQQFLLINLPKTKTCPK